MDSVQARAGMHYPLPYDDGEEMLVSSSMKQTTHPTRAVVGLHDRQDDAGKNAETERQPRAAAQSVSAPQAEAAWQRLLAAGYTGSASASLQEVMNMDPLLLSMLVTQQVMSVSSSNALALCEQLNRATELQTFLRNKQVEKYQEQINKSIEQANQVRKSALCSAVFDWISSAIEIGIGVLKLVEAVATADPLAFAAGIAYCSAGAAGIVKGGAEFALGLGANKADCEAIIHAAGSVQSTCEYVAMGLDILQICRGIYVARGLISAAEKEMGSGAGKTLVEAASQNSGEVGQQIKQIAENTAKGFVTELEARLEGNASQYLARTMGRSATAQGIEQLVEKTLESALKNVATEVLEKGAAAAEKALRKRFMVSLGKALASGIIKNVTFPWLTTARLALSGGQKITSGVAQWKAADLRKEIEELIVMQRINDIKDNWTQERKKDQEKQLGDYLQQSGTAVSNATSIMEDYGTVLAKIACNRA
ncbi:type III secretion system translocon subunit SctE [Candidatus Symbiopectobacterium sp. NZEC127]|uniref:type III secretion system translocon subunit SctE n=1 Tax=Candidatus Symbiopectobacterium sp. NZEC127 TaxID=2820472 RepID=UPI002226CF2F|nr:type III secretion system translocon subunit SctE [Candidatus Symbiopectobacterium sp. NZEC127]MCW2486824.1 type III secretion system translocon subunit SctE [Candidatus Symbiopectobacterium sp. NZEC127]